MNKEKHSHTITDHHIIARSCWGNRHYYNIAKLREVKHRALHTMHWNHLPHEQIGDIVDLTGQAINKVFSDAIMEVVTSFSPEEMYSNKCCNMEKLIRHIELTKNTWKTK